MHNIKNLIIGIGCICMLAGCGKTSELLPAETGGMQADKTSAEQQMDTQTEADTEQPDTQEDVTTQPDEPEMVAVYVCGAVKNTGVYYVSSHAIKEMAVQMAGGFSEDADETYVNLAEAVAQGERIYIPTREETAGMTFSGAQETVPGEEAPQQAADGRIDINTAGREQLMTLPGIGESKADAIIAYRQTQGKFRSTDELMNIRGIKEGVYNKIKDLIIVG